MLLGVVGRCSLRWWWCSRTSQCGHLASASSAQCQWSRVWRSAYREIRVVRSLLLGYHNARLLRLHRELRKQQQAVSRARAPPSPSINQFAQSGISKHVSESASRLIRPVTSSWQSSRVVKKLKLSETRGWLAPSEGPTLWTSHGGNNRSSPTLGS